jgi:hypothetical protein
MIEKANRTPKFKVRVRNRCQVCAGQEVFTEISDVQGMFTGNILSGVNPWCNKIELVSWL